MVVLKEPDKNKEGFAECEAPFVFEFRETLNKARSA
jgi:hypothetical protein